MPARSGPGLRGALCIVQANAGDFDGDGLADLTLLGRYVAVLHGAGGGELYRAKRFDGPRFYGTPSLRASTIADSDGNGFQDLAIVRHSVSVLLSACKPE